MRNKITLSILALLSATALATARAETKTDLSFGSGYQGNLFADSNSTGDAFATLGIDLQHYPSGSVQLAASGHYNHFIEYEDLSNFIGDLSVVIIPTGNQSRTNLSLSGAFSIRHFGDAYELYDQIGALISASLGYGLTPGIFLHSSAAFVNTSYTNADYGSSRSLDLSTGINLTLFGANSFALKGDFTTRSIDQLITASTSGSGHGSGNEQDNSDNYRTAGVSLRYSRPLSARTGFSFSAGYRWMHVDQGFAVYGYTIDYLSPWADMWEGPSFSAGLKHFFPHQIKADLSVARYDKSFVDIIESVDETEESFWFESRDDKLTAITLSLSRPFSLSDGRLVTPSFNFSYRDNNSTAALYDYDDMVVSMSLAMNL